MLAPTQSNPKKQRLLIGLVVVALIVTGWLLWRQFFGDSEPAAPVQTVERDEFLESLDETLAKDIGDLSFLRSDQFRELRAKPIQVPTSTQRTVNPFVRPLE